MYDELVKALRICEVGEHCDLCPKWDDKQNGGMNVCQTAICKEAADAIEKMSSYVRQIEELRKDGYYLQKTKMMTYGQATMTMPLPQPPKEET